MTGYPFLFWGRQPGDAYEGANLGHLYDLRFVREPSVAELRALAGVLAARTTRSPVELGPPVRWSGPWALLVLGERSARTRSPQESRALFYERVAALFEALHEVVPLAEVVYWNAFGPGPSLRIRGTSGRAVPPSARPMDRRTRAPCVAAPSGRGPTRRSRRRGRSRRSSAR